MAEERIYIIPLRQELKKIANWKRSKHSINLVRNFIKKHMKTEKVVINMAINELLWSRGLKRPPGKIKVKAIKDESKVRVELAE